MLLAANSPGKCGRPAAKGAVEALPTVIGHRAGRRGDYVHGDEDARGVHSDKSRAGQEMLSAPSMTAATLHAARSKLDTGAPPHGDVAVAQTARARGLAYADL